MTPLDAQTIARKSLQAINRWSMPAEMLVVGTAARESRFVYRRQLGGGPALGLCQMEPATHDDCWQNFIWYQPADLGSMLRDLAFSVKMLPDAEDMVNNDAYAFAMCRVRYWRAPGALPEDLPGMANYWKENYNSVNGAGTPQEWLDSWAELCAPLYPTMV